LIGRIAAVVSAPADGFPADDRPHKARPTIYQQLFLRKEVIE
jgi:hypothetical protein